MNWNGMLANASFFLAGSCAGIIVGRTMGPPADTLAPIVAKHVPSIVKVTNPDDASVPVVLDASVQPDPVGPADKEKFAAEVREMIQRQKQDAFVEVKNLEWLAIVGRWRVEGTTPDGNNRYEVEFVANREGSRTPYNAKFVVKRPGEFLDGGCGFYSSGTAYCKYGLRPKGEPLDYPRETQLRAYTDGKQLRFVLDGVFSATLDRVEGVK